MAVTFLPINIAASGDNVVISNPFPNSAILIYKLVLWAQQGNTAILKDGTSDSLNGSGFNFPAQGAFAYDGDQNPIPLKDGNAFIINLSSAQNVSGFVIYNIV